MNRTVIVTVCSQVNIAGPAGALVSTSRDMSRWMMWHLSGGVVPSPSSHQSSAEASSTRGRQLIDKALLWDTYEGRNTAFSRYHHHQQMTTNNNASDQHVAYDLGWITSYYRGTYGQLIFTRDST